MVEQKWEKAIVFVNIYSVSTRVVLKGKGYALFEIMSRHPWYFKDPGGGGDEPADEYKPLQKAIDDYNYDLFVELWTKLDMVMKTNWVANSEIVK